MSWYVYQITNSKFLLGLVSAIGSAHTCSFRQYGAARWLISIRKYDLSGDAIRPNDLRILAGGRRVARVRFNRVHHRRRCAKRHRNGIRHARAPVVHGRNDESGGFVERDITQQLDRERRAVGPSVAGSMIGAVGVAMCFFLNGLSFIAVIAGFLLMRWPPFERRVEIASGGRARMEESFTR